MKINTYNDKKSFLVKNKMSVLCTNNLNHLLWLLLNPGLALRISLYKCRYILLWCVLCVWLNRQGLPGLPNEGGKGSETKKKVILIKRLYIDFWFPVFPFYLLFNQCFGSGSGRIRIIWPDPYQETLIWIRVPKNNCDKLAYKSTKIIKI